MYDLHLLTILVQILTSKGTEQSGKTATNGSEDAEIIDSAKEFL